MRNDKYVNEKGEMWGEPSLACDVDDSLLYAPAAATATRTTRFASGAAPTAASGSAWSSTSRRPGASRRSRSIGPWPGTPYVVTNKLGQERDWLVILPLNDERNDLLPAIDVRNTPADIGPTTNGRFWFMDHHMGETLRLGDGQWHHVLSYRNMDRGEHAGGGPPPCSG